MGAGCVRNPNVSEQAAAARLRVSSIRASLATPACHAGARALLVNGQGS